MCLSLSSHANALKDYVCKSESWQGAGKTSLVKAMLYEDRQRNKVKIESLHPEVDSQKVVVGGVCYLDSRGVNLQVLF